MVCGQATRRVARCHSRQKEQMFVLKATEKRYMALHAHAKIEKPLMPRNATRKPTELGRNNHCAVAEERKASAQFRQ
ncbi:hypothetical protein CBM2592_U60004 [Cupriavidus taiwanensis]|uniref:Uncharacterized protein n=4 Tax=Cupriavidus TaxID=106589 RepID=A0A375CSW1_9BURK|nr:hypothetical protein CBM2592_U60004 [Cupriavidus taiwanensis]SOY78383.1 hypothetical protein CBM2586_U40004 [Cupriavidus taiwanensis]SOZ01118.1 hypothetical protein CBM2591_U60004 [Cupriavidus taiwanensis]SOZ40978.1 hypothetical protein CBM2605_U40005 [Cupriavidus neocaledonicus]